MGCFLACFGYTKKRKRLKPCNKIASQYQIHGSYVPLESDVFTELDNTPKVNISELRDKGKEISSLKKKKKVSFNLNVKTYEPLQYDESEYYLSDGEEAATWEFNKEEEPQRDTKVDEHHKADMIARNIPVPANYRYQNCRNSYDEEDEIIVEDSEWEEDDFDDEEDDDDDTIDEDEDEEEEEEEEDEDHSINQVNFPMFNSASVEANKTVNDARLANNLTRSTVPDKEPNGTESNHSVRHRNQYAYSVLNPVENLTQWKAIKSRAKLQKKHQSRILEQENELPTHSKLGSYRVPLNSKSNSSPSTPLIPEAAVHASLSNWLL